MFVCNNNRLVKMKYKQVMLLYHLTQGANKRHEYDRKLAEIMDVMLTV